jgi:hypothetical protein
MKVSQVLKETPEKKSSKNREPTETEKRLRGVQQITL